MNFDLAHTLLANTHSSRRKGLLKIWLKKRMIAREEYDSWMNSKLIEPELPGALQLARNAGKAVLRNGMELVRTGTVKVDPAKAEWRMRVCQNCPSKMFRESDQRCAHPKCGCYLKLKPWLKAERCPNGHW